MGFAIGLGISPTLGQGVGVPRTLDVGGPELVTNGQFPTDITGWTDASSAGGAIAFNSGTLRTTNTTGTARARQTCTVEINQRYSFFVLNPSGSVNGSISVGSTSPGTSDLYSATTNAAIAARAGAKEFTAPTTSAYLQLATGTAGNDDWDNVTLRKLIPTIFPAGTIFSDDFSVKADGPLGVTTDGLIWRQMIPQNAAHVYSSISSGKLVAPASGGSSSASYDYLHMGNGKATGIHCDIAWTGTGGTVSMVSLTPTATLPTVSNITANSLHIVFTDTKVDVQVYVSSSLTTVQTINYPVACATDGTVYTNVGWFLNGNTLTVRTPDGVETQITDSRFASVNGPVAIPEIYYGSAGAPPVSISKVDVRLG